MRPALTLIPAILVATTAGAQTRVVDLTGAPTHRIDEPFTQVGGVEEVAPGKVVTADMLEQRVVLIDFATGAVQNVGHQGGGPGEWQFPMAVLDGPGSRAMLVDPGLSKLHLIDATGHIVGSNPFPGSGNSSGMVRMVVPRNSDAAGRVFFTGAAFTPGQSEQPDSVPIIRYDPTSSRVDTLGRVENKMRVTQSGSGGSMRVAARVGGGPLSPETAWTALPTGGVAIVHPAPYRVDVIDANGRLTVGQVVPYTPIKVTAAERDAYRARMAAAPTMSIRMTNGAASISAGPRPNNVPEVPDDEFPNVMPPFVGTSDIDVSPGGEIWVLRSRAASDPTPSYDIFSPRGQRVGTARLRPHSTVAGFGHGVVYVTRQDPDTDLRYLESYTIR